MNLYSTQPFELKAYRGRGIVRVVCVQAKFGRHNGPNVKKKARAIDIQCPIEPSK